MLMRAQFFTTPEAVMARGKVPHHDPAALPGDVEALHPLAEQPGPRSLLEFQQHFASEEQCAEYLLDIRWPAGFLCPKCGSPTGYTLATRRRDQEPGGLRRRERSLRRPEPEVPR